MKTFDIEVATMAAVTIDETKFTPEFMEEFRKYFYDFDTIEDHARHLAQLATRGLIQTPCFIEGYGESKDMGIEVVV